MNTKSRPACIGGVVNGRRDRHGDKRLHPSTLIGPSSGESTRSIEQARQTRVAIEAPVQMKEEFVGKMRGFFPWNRSIL